MNLFNVLSTSNLQSKILKSQSGFIVVTEFTYYVTYIAFDRFSIKHLKKEQGENRIVA